MKIIEHDEFSDIDIIDEEEPLKISSITILEEEDDT